MADKFYTPSKRTQFVWVKDDAGNEYVCSSDALKDTGNISGADLDNCLDDSRYPQAFAGG